MIQTEAKRRSTVIDLLSIETIKSFVVNLVRADMLHRVTDRIGIDRVMALSEDYIFDKVVDDEVLFESVLDEIDESFRITCSDCGGGGVGYQPYNGDPPEPCDECLGHGQTPLSRIIRDFSTNGFLVTLRAVDNSCVAEDILSAAQRLGVPDVQVLEDYVFGRWPALKSSKRKAERFRQEVGSVEDMAAYHQLTGDFEPEGFLDGMVPDLTGMTPRW